MLLPRLDTTAIEESLTAVLVDDERFAVALGKDPDTGRYRGLLVAAASGTSIQVTDSTLLVEPNRAQQQADADRIAAAREAANASAVDGGTASVGQVDLAWASGSPSGDEDPAEPALETVRARFFGSVKINPDRYARDIGNITREIIDRLVGAGAHLESTIDIQATKPEGFNESAVRTIGENATVLKFKSSGFERS